MTTVRAWLYIIQACHMLHQLQSSHDNGQSMAIYPLSMNKVLSVVIIIWQWSERGNISFMHETLCQLQSSHDNGHSMVIYLFGMNHALSVVIISWQWSEHGNISFMYETCSVSCLWLMTMDRAWSYIPKVWNMRGKLSSFHDNGQSMVIYA